MRLKQKQQALAQLHWLCHRCHLAPSWKMQSSTAPSLPSPLLVLVLTPLILDEGGEDEDEERGSRKEGRK